MTESRLAAQLLHAREQHALIDEIAARDIPEDAGAAYAIQHEVLRLKGARIGAWKIGARTPSAPPAGAPIDESLVYASPARLEIASFFRVLIELEIAFRFERALPPRPEPYAREEVLGALGGMTVALEIVDSRFAQWPNLAPLAQLADAQNNGALVVGGIEPYNVIAPGFDFLAPRLDLTLDGVSIVPAGVGNPAGDPRELLVWFANHCSQRGLTVEPFWTVTTGTYTGAYRVEVPGVVRGSIDRIGEIELTLV
ncbi:2-keto-4-pentenoate hydratase [Caballeronia telluris]|uniref:2-keto-4-pentenoate hydratase-like protein n=1 Tax=Caballeronia telluris TaxID=326475 RepID=A0A158IE38_9BURK|nr:hydratase [Caballeronia telluris]SAL54270.1 2-keto-4-pentenoate hydratase-like protein [Caballeronia telluris]